MIRRSLRVLFCAAAGPGRGFGHLMRCRTLARTLGTKPLVALRGSRQTARVARKIGLVVSPTKPATLSGRDVDLVVIDDPDARHARAWVRAARRAGIPAATVRDAGLTRVASDLSIDGSAVPLPATHRADLQGVAFATVDPGIAAARLRPAIAAARPRRTTRSSNLVVVTLGGGRHVRQQGVAVARAIRELSPGARVQIIQGFGARSQSRLPQGCTWVRAPRGLTRVLARASVAVVAGGITMYEACALGTPVVVLPVVQAQRPAARALEVQGAVVDAAGGPQAEAVARAAALTSLLLARPLVAVRLGARAAAVVDGQGAGRVCQHLRALVAAFAVRRFWNVA
jgi:spore coat polysaccharide biosynthesis predicted glycosyltransferase SpsG